MPTKRICVLLEKPVKTDVRVIKIIKFLSASALVDLYYLNGEEQDRSIFNENVRLFSFSERIGYFTNLKKHTFFYKAYSYLTKEVLKRGVKYDLVYANDLVNLESAITIADQIGAEIAYDSHEIYLETLNQFFPAQSSGLKKIIFNSLLKTMRRLGANFEKKALNRVDHFITVNNSLAKYFKDRYNFKKEVRVVMNCPDIEGVIKPSINFRQEYNWKSEDKIFIFQGTLNQGRGLVLLINAMSKVSESVKLIIIGSGPLHKELEEIVKRLRLTTRVKFLGFIPSAELYGYTAAADFGVNLLEPINLSKKYTTATKLFEYIQLGLPSVCSIIEENTKILNKYKVGILTENEEINIAKSIQALAVTKDLSDYKNECEKAGKEYNWKNQTKELELLLTH